jgi:putative endonuclease
MTYRKEIGNWGENYAVEFLSVRGISIIARNVYTPYGEIDLVGREDSELVFFEVKTRTNRKFGNPEDSINLRKREHIMKAALHFVQTHPDEEASWRIDVISIQKFKKDEQPIQIEWFKNAIQ